MAAAEIVGSTAAGADSETAVDALITTTTATNTAGLKRHRIPRLMSLSLPAMTTIGMRDRPLHSSSNNSALVLEPRRIHRMPLHRRPLLLVMMIGMKAVERLEELLLLVVSQKGIGLTLLFKYILHLHSDKSKTFFEDVPFYLLKCQKSLKLKNKSILNYT